MFRLVETQNFSSWLESLRDDKALSRIGVRLERLSEGHMGDARSVGAGVSELRIHVGPGYRVYFTLRGERVILLLCGGDKSSQRRDIERAQSMVRMLGD